jgi:hypothetical protein
MAHVEDRWKSARTGGLTSRNGSGRRWRARWCDGPRDYSRSFNRKIDAEQFLEKLLAHACLVPGCRFQAVTEEPVLLCADHRDLVLAESGRKRPSVHAPLVYFVRNGSRIKIGWTTNLRGRMSSLALPQSAVALTLDGGPDLETALHAKFGRYRIKGTEWFEAAPALEAFIAAQQPAVPEGQAKAGRPCLPPGWLTIEEVARHFKVPVTEIRQWAKKRYGPKGVKLDGGVLAYSETEIERFELQAENAS